MAASKRTPGYLLHKPTGQARVRINGKDFYLGAYDSPASRDLYEALVGKWQRTQDYANVLITVDELVLAYLTHAKAYYVKDGKPTSEIADLRSALRPLVKLFGRLRVRDFGPIKLKTVREAMLELGWARGTINDQVHRLRRMFRWGTENELVPPEIMHGLDSVATLKAGRTTARDCPPVLPVDDQTVAATLPHLPPIVADMVRLQRLTGMRPQEVCLMRPGDIDRSGPEWCYRPARHKTQHRGRDRVIYIGPQGQAVLAPYLLRAADAYCFSPLESEKQRRARRHDARRTPLSCGNQPGKLNPAATRPPRERYDGGSYHRSIARACDRAFPVPEEIASDAQAVAAWRTAHRWSPNRIRHTFATLVRKEHGLEAAQVLLGHAAADVTQIYAERDGDKARSVARVVG